MDEVKRLYPHQYYVDLSKPLWDLNKNLLKVFKKVKIIAKAEKLSKTEIILTGKPILKGMIILPLPILLTNLIKSFHSVIDMFSYQEWTALMKRLLHH